MHAFLRSTLASLAIVALVASQAAAQTYTWKTSGFADNLFSNGNNWVGNAAPVSNTPNLKLVMAGVNSFATQDIALPPLVLQDLDINGYFQLYGNALQFDNLGANPTLTAANYVDLYAPVDFADPTTVTLANFSQLNLGVVTGGNVTFNGGGNSSVNISALGSLLTGTNTVNSGATVNFSVASGLAGTVNVAGGTLNIGANGAFVSGTDVNLSGGGVIYLQFGSNTVDDLAMSGGTMLTQGNLVVTGAITSPSGTSFVGQSSGAISLPSNASISVTSSGADYLNVSGPIVTGSFTKTGAGKLVLGTFGTNTFSGTNTVSAGTLRGSAQAIGTVVNNANVELVGGAVGPGHISGTGNVLITGGIADYNALQTYGGTTTIDGGSLLAEVTTIPALVTGVGSGGGVTFEDVGNVTHTGTLAGLLSVAKSQSGVLTLGGSNPYSLGTYVGTGGGGFAIASDTAIGTGQLAVYDPANTLEAVGSRTLANSLFVGNGATFQGSGSFNFTDTTPKLLSGPLVHNSTGTTIIGGKHDVNPGASITVNSGTLALGNGSVVNGFTSAGPVTVNGGTLSLNSLNFINLPTVTLAGGTLNVPNGYAIPLGAVLTGNGGVTGRLATANGSTIIASGNLALGDAAHPAGVNLDGELYTNANTVTLDDSNQAVLGSLTDIGTPTQNGTVVAPNGAVLNFGRNIVGRGQIQSNNTLADAVIVNGDVNGDSITNYLEFTGYVKGVGTFNNAAFSGTFAPGLSPTLMTVGNTILLPSNVLDMELGGLNRGSQYDAFDVTPSSTMALNGTLKLSLINAFNPALGNQFNLFDGTTAGAFTSFNFPALNAGLMWDTSLLYTQGIVQVVTIPEPAAWSLALVAAVAAMKRRRQLAAA